MADQDQRISTGFIPRVDQLKLNSGRKRFTVSVTHRRFGKSHFWVNHQINKATRMSLPMPRLFYVAPTFAMAKRIVWDVFKRYAGPIPGATFNENDLRVDFAHNNSRIQLLSAENPRANVGIYSDDVVFDEFGDQPPSVWTEVFRPTLSDRKGTAAFAGTLRGTNHFWDLYQYALTSGDPEWAAFMFKASETGIIPEDELASLKRTMPEEEYLQEYECDPMAAGAIGAYFAKDIAIAMQEGRIGKVPYDPEMPVDTYWDLGMDDATSIWFGQSTRGRHQFIDYLEVSDSALQNTVKLLQDKKFVYGRCVLPHDANVRDLSAHGRSRRQVLGGLGMRNISVTPRPGNKMESIDAARRVFKKCYFDAEKCAKGIKALQQYKKIWNEKTQAYGESPRHDWSSHAADSFQTFALGSRDDSRHTGVELLSINQNRSGQLEAEMEYNPYER